MKPNKLNVIVIPSAKTCILAVLAPIALSQLSSAAVLANYTLNTTNLLTATAVASGVTAGNFVINSQLEDTDGAPTANDRWRHTASGLEINRPNSSTFWDQPGATVLAPFQFTITAGANDVQVDSITATASASPGHITAIYFGSSAVSVNPVFAGYGAGLNFATGGETKAVSLPANFTILAGQSRTFHIDLNSNALDSTHQFGTFIVNGTVIPEPSSALLGSLGMLALLRRRRN